MVVFPQTSLSLASTLFYKASSLTIFCAFAAALSRWYDTKILNLESGAACIGDDVAANAQKIVREPALRNSVDAMRGMSTGKPPLLMM